MHSPFRQGPRIEFRTIETEDVDTCRGWLNDPENHAYLQRFRPIGRTEEQEWVASQGKSETDVVFGIALREGGRLIGSCGLHRLSQPHRWAELGILIGVRELQGKGYGAEAIRLMLAYAFETLNLHRVQLHVYGNNARGIACYEKCGFRREGVRREARWWAGRWWDVFDYALLEHEWRDSTQILRGDPS